MAPSDKTIRLVNNGPMKCQVSLNLALYADKSGGRLRRGLQLRPVLIAHNRYLDVCADLGVGLDEARRIVRDSIELRHFIASRQVEVMEWPPATAPALAPAPLLPEVPEAPTTIIEAARALLTTQALFAAPAAGDPQPPPAEATSAEAEPPAPPPDAEVPTPPPAEERQLSSDWTHAELVAYAKELGVDPSGSKVVLLKRLRGHHAVR